MPEPKCFPKYLTTLLFTQPFSRQLTLYATSDSQRLEAQEKEPEGHWYNKNLLTQLWSPLLETLRLLVCYLSNAFLQPCLGRAGEVKVSCSTYIYTTPVVGLWVQLEALNASTTQVWTIGSASLLNGFPWTTAPAICTSLHLCFTYPQKCFDLLFVRPLDKYINHQHNHPITIQLRRSPCQLVLCVNDPFQKNRLPVFLWVPSLPA